MSEPARHRWVTVPRIVAAVLVLLVVLLVVNYARPVPPAAAEAMVNAPRGSSALLPWPATGQAAIGALDAGVSRSSPTSRPRPIASVAKVMAAMVVVDAKPLQLGERGPTITVTAEDVAAYAKAQAAGESVVQVQAGEQLTEFQALEALLVPSGNNFSDLLLRWALGSVPTGVARMNAEASHLGMKSTTFADASGVSPKTQSTPGDLVMLGEAAIRRDVIAEIVSRPQVNLPVAGTAYNVNAYLGINGINGIKTGNILEAGACFLFSAAIKSQTGQSVTVVGAVMGLPTLDLAFRAADALVTTARQELDVKPLVMAGQVVGRYRTPWGESVDVIAQRELDGPVWPGAPIAARLDPSRLDAPRDSGEGVGSLFVDVGEPGHTTSLSVPVVLKSSLGDPSPLWRLTRI
jgi:D-alanyl-D-alanine carboxypeptidase (penicillin-binding protein 5/6)